MVKVQICNLCSTPLSTTDTNLCSTCVLLSPGSSDYILEKLIGMSWRDTWKREGYIISKSGGKTYVHGKDNFSDIV